MVKDENVHARDLAIIEKYEAVVTYLYPIFQAFPKRHGALRDSMIAMLMETVGLLYQAAKSKQASRLYAADAHLATLRFWLRFASAPSVRILSPHQHQVALRQLAEVGAMLGQWIKGTKSEGR